MNILTLAAACFISTIVMLPVMGRLVRAWNLRRVNFHGVSIPAGFGFLIVTASVPVYLLMLAVRPHDAQTWMLLVAVIGFGTIGLIDDIFGTRRAGGFHGHLGLLRHGKLSTGLAKMAVGGILGLGLGGVIAGFRPAETVVNGLLISLSANLLNLLDLRPGRAVSCFWVGMLALAAARYGVPSMRRELIPVLIPTVWLTFLDRSAKVMLGDAGSNLLGAVMGLALACETGFLVKLALIAFMIGVHAYAEKYSISKLIESNKALRSVDRLLGVR